MPGTSGGTLTVSRYRNTTSLSTASRSGQERRKPFHVHVLRHALAQPRQLVDVLDGVELLDGFRLDVVEPEGVESLTGQLGVVAYVEVGAAEVYRLGAPMQPPCFLYRLRGWTGPQLDF